MGFSENDIYVLGVFTSVSGVASLIGSSLIIISFMLFSRLRNFHGRLVLYLSVCDALWTLATLYGAISSLITKTTTWPKIPCFISGWVLQWFIVAEDLWVAGIGIFLFLKIRYFKETAKQEWVYHLITWPVSLIVSLVPIMGPHFLGWGKGYGPAGLWCWISDPAPRLFYSYFFVWMTWVLIVVLYLMMILHIRKISREMDEVSALHSQQRYQQQQENIAIFKKLAAFPIVWMVQWIPATVNRIQNVIDPENPIMILFVFHITFTLSSGFVNFVLYGTQNWKTIKANWAMLSKSKKDMLLTNPQ